MKNIIKTIGKAFRGLTFSLENKYAHPGEHYRYIVDKESRSIRIIKDENGVMTVSRKRSGNGYKPLFDIRSKEVKSLVRDADYTEIELLKDAVLVHCLKKAEEEQIPLAEIIEGRFVDINDLLAKETGIIRLAVGESMTQAYTYGNTLSNDEYFNYLVRSVPSYMKRSPAMKKDLQYFLYGS